MVEAGKVLADIIGNTAFLLFGIVALMVAGPIRRAINRKTLRRAGGHLVDLIDATKEPRTFVPRAAARLAELATVAESDNAVDRQPPRSGSRALDDQDTSGIDGEGI